MLHTDRPIDIIVYGATGFTGKLVCEYLKTRYLDNPDENLSIAIGGRSRQKLENVKSEAGLSDEVKIFVADSHNEDKLDEMTQQTKTVLALVGPYALYGDALIAACVKNGTHYFDLSAETAWSSLQIAKLDAQARESKAIIIHSCGYDSVPSDLNVMLAVRELKRLAGSAAQVGRVTSGAYSNGGIISGGTLASALNMYDAGISTLRKVMACYVLSPVEGPQKTSSRTWITREPGLIGGFFLMGPHNGAIVRRSWGLMEASVKPSVKANRYGENFTYDEYLLTSGALGAFILTLVFRIFGFLLFIPLFRSLVRKYGPQSGEGPDEKTRKSGKLQMITTAHSVKDDVQVRVTMNGTGDPGYHWTSICISECAVTCVKCHKELPLLAQHGGFLTPSTGLGDALLRRLEGVGSVTIKTNVLKNGLKKKL
ncbi:hypothetical protein O181_005000 [Austropuccinia psidii MF-1]|uniref:Saccharopine dehydrogenase NADP binding domain-containing protein n=1 Tax=Austropuccinia psidii MF-1 TaxID=1389203 RepID=A0A9Q3BI45_9BASI|nr:hypothetical protein [Austropuccinia psidii MF-1]